MKKKLLGILSLSLLSASVFGQTTNYEVGDIVDDFTVTDTEGNEHSLYEITASGKHVYLDFFFDTCPPCQATSPVFGEFYNKYGCNSGDVYCLVINNGTDSDEEVMAYEEMYGGDGHHAPAVSAEGGGGAVTGNFGVGAFPTYVLIGPDNRLIQRDIYPIAGVTTFEATFYEGFTPDPSPCGIASVKEEQSVSGFSIYPNPASSIVSLTFTGLTPGQGLVEVYTMLGEIVYTNVVPVSTGYNSHTIDLQDLNQGNYIIRVTYEETILTKKLQVNK